MILVSKMSEMHLIIWRLRPLNSHSGCVVSSEQSSGGCGSGLGGCLLSLSFRPPSLFLIKVLSLCYVVFVSQRLAGSLRLTEGTCYCTTVLLGKSGAKYLINAAINLENFLE